MNCTQQDKCVTKYKQRNFISIINNNKAISMMRGKSPPSELILEVIKSNKSLRFLTEFGMGDNFYFCQNIILFYFFTFILITQQKYV